MKIAPTNASTAMRGLKKRELSIAVSERVVPHARLYVSVSTCATALVAMYYAFAVGRGRNVNV